VKIELLFSKEIGTLILERVWHEKQKLRQEKDGSVYLSFQSNQFQETLHWVMSFGSAVKVLNPPELAEQVKDEAKKMAKMY
jgi:predicted DNA-binding transcriptional regulator YafY